MAKKQLTPEQYKAKIEKKAAKRKKFAGLFLKTLAFCLAIAITFSASSIAFKKIGTLTAVGGIVVSTNTNTGSTSTGTSTNTPVDNSSSSTTPDSSTPGDSSTGEQAGNTDASSKDAEDLAMFMKALKGVKTNAKSATQTKKNAYNYEQHVDAKGNALIESAGKSLMGSLLKPEDTNVTYSGADIAANFPPSGATSGDLTVNDIEDIDVKEEGNYYIVTVVVKGVKNPQPGQGVGAVATILTKESIQDPIKNVPIINSLEPNCDYRATTAEAKIEKSTGNLVEYYFDLPMYLYMGEYSVGLGFEEWWTVAY